MVEAFAEIDYEKIDPILSITTKAALACPQASQTIGTNAQLNEYMTCSGVVTSI
jgi:hypothetical protein